MHASLQEFARARKDLSWVSQLDVDPQHTEFEPNRSSREVFSGHFVPVRPLALPEPELVAHSSLAEEVGLSEEAVHSEAFVRFFSGEQAAVPEFDVSWATPYALSIYGQPILRNCPFGTGNGYGDGRAISVAEVVAENGRRYEFQLKGGGPTPWCRGADGRAVLRSSVREFLASEFMHHAGVSTTRALSLVVSNRETVQRPWYSNTRDVQLPSTDDPRLARFPPEYREQLLQQLAAQQREPDVMQSEKVAITCRVARSFLRVGHVELFSRRYVKGQHKEQLEKIVRHAMFREYAGETRGITDVEEAALVMLRTASERFARLTANWIRVGYVQGNFNSDNCLVGGRTMDYGPFGFTEMFQPLWNMWQSGGDHFGFLNQPVAGHKNYTTLVHAVQPMLSPAGQQECERLVQMHMQNAVNELNDVWARKLGLLEWQGGHDALIRDLLDLLERSKADYTMFFRQLASDENGALQDVFYAPLSPELERELEAWVGRWRQRRDKGYAERMRAANPKYVPREWMLVDAYTAANKGDYSLVRELEALFRDPYGEQPTMEAKYYRKAPPEVYAGVGRGGTAYMS